MTTANSAAGMLIQLLKQMRGPFLGDGFTNVSVPDLIAALSTPEAAKAEPSGASPEPNEAALLARKIKSAMSASLMSDKIESEQCRNIDKLVSLVAPQAGASLQVAPEPPDENRVMHSRVCDLLHLLQFATITTPSEGDAEQARKCAEWLRRWFSLDVEPLAVHVDPAAASRI